MFMDNLQTAYLSYVWQVLELYGIVEIDYSLEKLTRLLSIDF